MKTPASSVKNPTDISTLWTFDSFSTFSKKGSIDFARPFFSIIFLP
jgi:hypothetical protein